MTPALVKPKETLAMLVIAIYSIRSQRKFSGVLPAAYGDSRMKKNSIVVPSRKQPSEQEIREAGIKALISRDIAPFLEAAQKKENAMPSLK